MTGAWVDVDMRLVPTVGVTDDWWRAFHARTPGRELSGGIFRVPCASPAAAGHTAALLRAFGITGAALTVGDAS